MASFEAMMKKFLEDYEKQTEDSLIKEFMVFKSCLVQERVLARGEEVVTQVITHLLVCPVCFLSRRH